MKTQYFCSMANFWSDVLKVKHQDDKQDKEHRSTHNIKEADKNNTDTLVSAAGLVLAAWGIVIYNV